MVERYREYHAIINAFLEELDSEVQAEDVELVNCTVERSVPASETKMKKAFLEVLKEEFS